MTHFFNSILSWFSTLFKVWRREFRLVFSDEGVMLFFFFLTLAYPIVYTLIYNTETVRDIPIIVVDNSRSEASRELVRMVDATEAIDIYDYADNLQNAHLYLNEHKAFGVLEIPYDYAKKIGRGEQSVTTFYSDMSLLLRYRAFLLALTSVQLALDSDIQQSHIDNMGLSDQPIGDIPIKSEEVFLGVTNDGFASFVIPGILVLIIQQSLILGVTMLAAGSRERRRKNGGIDPLAIQAGAFTTIIGKAFCYVLLYIPICLYALHIVPEIFSLPHIGNTWEYLIFILPMLFAASFLGITLSVFVTERESSMLVVVFSSVAFLFLSGLTWPRYAMNDFWTLTGNLIPSTWGIEGFIRMNTNGSLLAEQQHAYTMLWILAGIYMFTAYLITYSLHPSPPQTTRKSAICKTT